MLLLLSACLFITDDEHAARLAGFGGGDDTAGDNGGGGGEPIDVDAVEPSWGPSGGQTRVVVSGGPFDASARVWFGEEAGQVESVTTEEIVVYTPPADPGVVAVRVETETGSGRLADAYTYWEDGTGKVGAIGEFAMFVPVGGYWGESTIPYRRASVSFVEPADEWTFWKYWGPTLDECLHIDSSGVYSWDYSPGLQELDAGGGELVLTELSYTTLDLPWIAEDLEFGNYDILGDAFIPGGVYSGRVERAPNLPEMEIAGMFYLPEAFTVTTPAIDSPSLPTIDRDISVRWSGGSPADAVLLQFGMLNASKSTFEEQVYCAVRDDGSFDVPRSMWEAWAPGRLMNILIGRYRAGDGVIPVNDSDVATVGEYWLYGAAETE